MSILRTLFPKLICLITVVLLAQINLIVRHATREATDLKLLKSPQRGNETFVVNQDRLETLQFPLDVVVVSNCKRTSVLPLNTTSIWGRPTRFFKVCDSSIQYWRASALVRTQQRTWCPQGFHFACQSQDLETLCQWLLTEDGQYFLILEDDVRPCDNIQHRIQPFLSSLDPNLLFLGRGNLGILVKKSFLSRLSFLHSENHATYLDLHVRGNCKIPEDRCFALKHSLVEHVHNIRSVVGHGTVPFACNDTDPDMQWEGLRWLPVVSLFREELKIEHYDIAWNSQFLQESLKKGRVETNETPPRYLTPIRGPSTWGQNVQYKLSPTPYSFDIALWTTPERLGLVSLRSPTTGHFVTLNVRKVIHQYSLLQRDALWHLVRINSSIQEYLIQSADGLTLGYSESPALYALPLHYLVAWERSVPFEQNTLCLLAPGLAEAERQVAAHEREGDWCLIDLVKAEIIRCHGKDADRVICKCVEWAYRSQGTM